jgi:YcxB-like protein
MPAITFSVSYGLLEYLSFVHAHFPLVVEMLVAEGKMKKRPPRVLYPLALLGAPVAFLRKKRSMPVCDFTIDEREIRRVTKDGTLVTPWNSVLAVRRYPRGYFIDKGLKGAMPLPYRCFSPEQKAEMEELIRAFEASKGSGR